MLYAACCQLSVIVVDTLFLLQLTVHYVNKSEIFCYFNKETKNQSCLCMKQHDTSLRYSVRNNSVTFKPLKQTLFQKHIFYFLWIIAKHNGCDKVIII